MKKLIAFFVLVFCLSVGFAQDVQYTNADLLDYLWCQPKSHLPEEGEEVDIYGGEIIVLDAAIDGNGIDYLVTAIEYNKITSSPRYIYIYGENIETDMGFDKQLKISKPVKIIYTGKTVPGLNAYGKKIEIPVFIEKGL